ncbi:BrnA antitoxin family protein [Devosia ginsengisoli]|uniref:BrnA antitoxin family protein n=1 Tax=Devosia ginsengisoli TaxID=400770 RepID=A0A5B8LSL2_9HYPH|nr:BrnA antitoxin family protein [Devosia ginsengisoli]QDZ11317.1 BrnA antitoxin family protein [Devosia ginsengisoli]
MSASKPGTPNFSPDPDDAPELDDAWFESADQHDGGSLVKRGRPALPHPKKHLNIRLDADVVDRFKASGPGWQSRMNDVLRKAVGL